LSAFSDQDKTAFWNRIRGDPWIQKTLGIVGAPDSTAAKYILKRNSIDEQLDSKSLRILIFDPPARELSGGGGISTDEECVIQVDVLLGLAHQNIADDIKRRIIALCGQRWNVRGRPIHKVVSAGELTSQSGFYRTGARFFYYSTTLVPLD
jgi:hypothetical protein